MIHARSDYNRIQDPAVDNPELFPDASSPISEDEPVFLVRAKDDAFCETLTAWMKTHLDNGGDPKLVIAVAKHLGKAISWREKNETKTADAPPEVL